MKLFGKKGGDAPPPDNNDLGEEDLGAPDIGTDDGLSSDPSAAPDDIGAPPGEKTLTAPTRSLAAVGGGGRKNLLILLLLVVAAGIGGAYFYFMGDSTDYSQPVHVTAKSTPMPVADNSAAPPQPAPVPAQPEAPPATTASATPPAPAPAPDPLAPQPAPGAAPPATPTDPLATAPQPAVPPAATDPLASPPPAPGTQAPGLGAPPTDDANAQVPTPVAAGAPVQSAPNEVAPDMPKPDAAAPVGATAAAAPGTPATGAAPATPGAPAGEDLPIPAQDAMLEQPLSTAPANAAPGTIPGATPGTAPGTTAPAATGAAPADAAAKPAETAPSWAAPGTAAVPGTSNPAAKASSPTDAELAIVQNAAVLDQLTRPVTPGGAPAPSGAAPSAAPTGMPFDPNGPKPGPDVALQQIQKNLEKIAVKRQLPSGYMIIRKEADEGDVDSRLIAARTALAQGRSPAALELFDDLEKDYPKDKRILMGRAVSLQKLGQTDEALAAYEAVLNRDPKNLDALSNMLGLLKSKDPSLAVEKLQELRDTYPYQGDITAQLGIAYAANGQYEEGLKYLEMADNLKPGSAYVLYNKAVLLDKMGRTHDAAMLYRSILRKASEGELDQQLPLDTIRNRLAVMR